LGGFNFSKISKSILEFYFLRFCCKYDWNLWCLIVSDEHFSWNETKRLISNTSYLGYSDHKLHRCDNKLSKFLSFSQIGPEKNINNNPWWACVQPFWSSLIYTIKSKCSSYHWSSSFPNLLLVWYRTNILDSHFWNHRRFNHRSCFINLVNHYYNCHYYYSNFNSRKRIICLLYFLWSS